MLLSTDNTIERIAQERGSTYDAVFKEAIKPAEQHLQSQLAWAVKTGQDIVWDQTNVTAKSRAPKLAKIPDTYEKIAVFFKTPAREEHQRRLKSRPGKTIPHNIIMGMISSLQEPQDSEGFDQVIFV